MPPRKRNNRQAAAKRNILGVLNGDVMSSSRKDGTLQDGGDCVKIPSNFDGTEKESLEALLDDMDRELNARNGKISFMEFQANKELQEVYFLQLIKLERNIRNMTLREYDARNSNREGILETVKKLMTSDAANDPEYEMIQSNISNYTTNTNRCKVEFETPARTISHGKSTKTPGTLLRTVRRGEAIFSVNGSPLDQTDKGDLVATVLKKRKDGNAAAVFEINVGDGKYISLTDPSALSGLGDEMKNFAITQIKCLQDVCSAILRG